MSRLEGVPELKAMLGRLKTKYADASVRKALRESAKVQQASLLNSAPDESGATRGAIKVRAMKRSRVRVGMMVTISKDFLQSATFYVGFVLWGWIWSRHRRARVKTRVKGKTNNTTSDTVGKGEKRIPGTLWAEKAWEGASAAAVDRAREVLREEYEKYAQELK